MEIAMTLAGGSWIFLAVCSGISETPYGKVYGSRETR